MLYLFIKNNFFKKHGCVLACLCACVLGILSCLRVSVLACLVCLRDYLLIMPAYFLSLRAELSYILAVLKYLKCFS